MYLKSIEIHGFKSFANKIVFQFHNGITGIVGPNGSGKSNVADAVRWVLGEQRIKQLRGASMQDVIFSGTESRKPLSYAFVAITLDNSDHQLAIDFDEVTVARRIYRSGESEYLINGSPVRLKDVNELFYDTGIGKEGYSIIGQGQIDKILSGKPEERRELFDEAAGIVKFKRRKAAAQSKLENEKQNLVRINDILSELEKQVEPLEKQSEKAREYLKKKESLKALDINVFLLENNRLKEELKGIEDKYDIASRQLAETTKEYEGIREKYDQVEKELEELDLAIEESRETKNMTGLMRGKMEGQIEVIKEQIHSAKGTRDHQLERQKTVKEELSAKEAQSRKLLADKAGIDKEAEEMKASREEAKEKLSQLQNRVEKLSARIEDDKNLIIEELNQRALIKTRMGRFDTMMEQINIRKAQMNSRLLRAKSDEAEREEHIKGLEEIFEKITQELREMEKDASSGEAEIAGMREHLQKEDETLRQTQNLYMREKSRLDALNNLTERYEGYGGSVKKIMEQKEKNPGIIGVVADIIKTEKRFETAMETALGGSIQNIVTDNEETAKEMIRFLKAGRLGRATFLPLTSLTRAQGFHNNRALEEPGVIGVADSLVQIEEKYRNVAKSLLGRILVVDNMDHAVAIARKFDFGIRMVTLEGELLSPGGAISGGAFKNSSNLLGRRREIEDLEKQIRKLKEEADACSKGMETLREERNKKRVELENLKTAIQRKSIEQNTARLNISQARERMEEEEEGYQGLKEEQQEIEKQILEVQQNKENTLQELKDSEALEEKTQEEIGKLQEELKIERSKENEASQKVTEWELKTEKLLQTQGFHQANIDRVEGEMEKSRAELAEIETALAQAAELMQEREKAIEEIKNSLSLSEEKLTQSEQKLKDDLVKRETLGNSQKSFFQRREELSDRRSILDKEVYRLNAQKEKLEEAVENQINYMWEEYEITLSDAAALREEALNDLPGMKKEIASLKEQIKKLGDVNVNAIEEYKSLMERYTFLKSQHDDLVEAEKTLEGIIQELDSAMRKQFAEKFAQINQEFDKVFKELFGGGKGTLELMEDEDILEAGIRIIAQPPGKKLQNMMQLSGGEKALAAISLLFAIQNLKPSPFCLLDEIEAALDESNVGRFAKYLHKLTKNTQFIVITHRRGTMEEVDRLYGITMQEKGVSALVSVNLVDKDLT